MFLLILATYSFEVTHTDTVVNVQPESLAIFRFHLYNTGTDDDVYILNLVGVDWPSSWFVQFCYSGGCLFSGLPYRVNDSISAGNSDTLISIEVFTDTLHYNGIMRFTIRSQGEPSLMDTFFLYVNTTEGIEEIFRPVDMEPGVYYSIDGRKVVHPGPGIYFLKQGRTLRKVVIIK